MDVHLNIHIEKLDVHYTYYTVYTLIYIYIYVYIYVCMYVCMYVYIYGNVCYTDIIPIV